MTPVLKDVLDFISSHFKTVEDFDRFMDIVSLALHGEVCGLRRQHGIAFLSGDLDGVLEVVRQTFGDYACELPINVFTTKNVKKWGIYDPYDLTYATGRRVATTDYRDNTTPLTTDLLARITMGDDIITQDRQYKSQFTLFVQCDQSAKPGVNKHTFITGRRPKQQWDVKKFKQVEYCQQLLMFLINRRQKLKGK